MTKPRILVLRKMSALEYYYKHQNKDPELKNGHDNHSRNVELVKQILTAEGIKFDLATREEISESIISEYDALFSLGGDGTAVAGGFFNKNTPQLNLVSDDRSEGVLCQKDIPLAIANFLSGNYRIENWTKQDVFLDGKFIARPLNETCVGEDGLDFSQMARYDLEVNYNHYCNLGRQIGSGLVIATGTGSTGWKREFSPFPRTANWLEFSAISPVRGMEKGRGRYFRITYKKYKGTFKVDATKYDFPRDSVLEIKLSEFPLRVIVPNLK